MEMKIGTVLLILVIALEGLAVYLQVQHMKKVGAELREQGRVLAGKYKPTFTRGCSVALAVNKRNIVKKAKITKGMGAFNRFKDYPEIEGMSLDEIRKKIIAVSIDKKGFEKSRAIALDNALNSYNTK